jgi:hypothetical protein
MPGHWRHLGLVGSVAGAAPWAVSHSALPALISRPDGGNDLYVSTRDAQGRARIARGQFSLGPVPTLDRVERVPVLDVGALGTFDDRGVTMSSIVTVSGRMYLYYTGWMLGVTVPFYLAAGVAVSDDGGATFRRVSAAPLLDRNEVDPFLTASPFVLVENGIWRMWYVSGSAWNVVDGLPRHSYHIKYAESSDGIRWRRDGHVCLDYGSVDEYAFGRPFVRCDGSLYRMWYSCRGAQYRIGYAESLDGLTWTRKDSERGLGASGSGWDGQMVEYPWIFESQGHEYMLYNGDGYGRTGVGLALWETDSSSQASVGR